LQELVPKAVRVGLLVNSRAPNSEAVTRDLQAAASAIGVELVTVGASDSREIDAAFLTLAGKRVAALVVGTRRLLLRPACPDHHPRDAPWSAKYLQREGLCGSRWSDDLWYELDGGLPSGRCLCRSHPQRREACRLAGGSIEQIRVHHQPSDRTSPRPRGAANAPHARRRGDRVKRRDFITLLGGSAAWPLAARAQQGQRMRRIGVLLPAAPDDAEFQSWIGAFLQGLAQSGWITGRNIRIETRWTKFDSEETRKYAAELVALAPDVILATGNSTVRPLLRLTRTVPIVFPLAADPVASGPVESLARPGGNVTGFMSFEVGFSAK